MDKIKLSIYKDGTEIASSDEITKIIPKGGISIDEEALNGLDNFVVNERRASVKLRKLSWNNTLNDTLIAELTNQDNLLQDNVPSETISAYVFSREDIENKLSDEKLFWRYFNTPDEQTHTDVNSKILYVQSKELVDIFYTMFNKDVQKVDGTLYPPGTRNAKITYSQDGYTFNYGMPQAIAMFARHCQIADGIGRDSDKYATADAIHNYFDSIYTGSGLSIEAYIETKQLSSNFNYYLYHIFSMVYSTSSEWKYPPRRIFQFISEWMNTNSWKYKMPGDDTEYDITNTDSKQEQDYRMAIMLASMISYESYTQVRDEYFLANQDEQQCRLSAIESINRHTYVPFFNAQELVYRYNTRNVAWNKYNIFFDWAGGTITNLVNLKYAVIRLNNVGGGQVTMFGKKSRKTNSESTESNMEIDFIVNPSDEESYNSEGLFIPVNRVYKLRNTNFASVPSGLEKNLYIDNFNYSAISGTPGSNAMCLTNYNKTNWMYFDNLLCQETYSPLGGTTDVVPVFDSLNPDEQDNYGLYIYKDFFNKFYTKEPSNLTKLVCMVESGSNILYTGVIDFSTVKISREYIEFSTTDAVGLLTENINKLADLIEFSQFDKNNLLSADTRAGVTIYDVLYREIISRWPYRVNGFGFSSSFKDSIAAQPILKNKVLSEISSEEALFIGVHVSKKLLYSNNLGQIDLIDINTSETPIEIEDNKILSMTTQQNVDKERFSVDKIKKLAGFEPIVADVAAAYNSFRNRKYSTLEVELYGYNSIKVLDKITMLENDYTVISISREIGRNITKLTVIGD